MTSAALASGDRIAARLLATRAMANA